MSDKNESKVDEILDDVSSFIDPQWMTLEEAIEWTEGLVEVLQERIEIMKEDLERKR